VLFVLLVWTRHRVEVEEFEPSYFKAREIFPMTNALVRSLAADQKSLLDIGTGWITGDFVPKAPKDAVAYRIREWFACDSAAHDLLADGMKSLLRHTVNGVSLESHFLNANPRHAEDSIRESLDKVKTYNISQILWHRREKAGVFEFRLARQDSECCQSHSRGNGKVKKRYGVTQWKNPHYYASEAMD
jgi:hypothetical protein